MHTGYFITGTDTGVGKTLVSCLLLQALNQRGLQTTAMKPVASGSHLTTRGRRNDDAEQLQQAASVYLDYDLINPYALTAPIAPHLAADIENTKIDVAHILGIYQRITNCCQVTIIEGVGGWSVPLDSSQSMADLAAGFNLPVIMVVGIRLGCINHGLLTAQAIQQAHHNINLAGWVANITNPETHAIDNVINSLKERINAPLIGTIPYLENAETRTAVQQSGFFDIDLLDIH